MTFEILEIDPKLIKIREDLPRVRNDLGEIKKLAESFQKYGQLQPIVVNREMELIAGGRRLAACLLSNRKALITYKDTLDPLTMREMELEENLQRKSLLPAEELMAVDEIHRIKQALYGESSSGKPGVGWTTEMTAALVGRTRTSIVDDLKLAEALKQFPSLKDCATKSEIRKAVKGMEKLSQRLDAVKDYETQLEGKTNNLFSIQCMDALEHMLHQTKDTIDLLLTDPIYGIDINDNAMGVGGVTGGHSISGFKYDDTKAEALKQYRVLANESIRFCKETSHALVFTSPTNFCALRDLFREAGWLCSDRPVIWIKNETGQNNNPTMWFSSTYEILLYARRKESRLVTEGKPDWIQCQPVLPSERMHQAQKPIPLLKELIMRTILPGSIVYDPFMGSGSVVLAALDMKCFPIACDIAQESYATTLHRVMEWKKLNSL